jgi:farnesyl diphosphate synthase
MDFFEQKLSEVAELLEPKLDELLPKDGKLAEAMRYAVLGAGKRFRPFLVLESAALFGVPNDRALNVAAAIECLHCYSLVHDDLPAMDDDDTRRGKPSVHKVFGEATAILAGDALQALAFEILAMPETHADANVRAELILGLARAAGQAGMAGGQEFDMEAESVPQDMEGITRIQKLKTGALIQYSVDAGAVLGGARTEDRTALATCAEKLGVAYDLSDQLMDVDQDAAAGKSTVVSLIGAVGAKEMLEHVIIEAIAALEPFGARAGSLREAATFMSTRLD